MLECALELVQEAHVVLEVEAQVLHAIFEHCDALNSHTKGEARILLGIDVAGLQHVGVYHTATHNLEPPRTLADGATLATACLFIAKTLPEASVFQLFKLLRSLLSLFLGFKGLLYGFVSFGA